MRDILITLIVFGSLPLILRRPFVGVIMWTWLGLMNPHRMAWGFSLNFPFAFIVFLVTVLAYMMSREPKRIPLSREIVLLALFLAWMLLSTTNAMFQVPAWEQWDKVWRVQLGVLLTLMLTTSMSRIHALVWTIGVSLGFYGIKGGLWSIMTGGTNRVYGPNGTFIGGNNEIGLALVMTAPLLWYLAVETSNRKLKLCLYGATGLTLIAIVGTHSRGAFLGIAVMGLMMFMKAKRKLLPLLMGLAFAAALPHVAPQEWFDRMHTIETYEEDKSATNRIKAWGKSIDIANQRVTGGGYEFIRITNGVDCHSIYFEILSEHGWPGLVMFLGLGALTFFKCGRVRKLTRKRPEMSRAYNLASMLQVSLAGYATSGAFLGLAYFDFFYVLVVVTVVLYAVVRDEIAAAPAPAASAPPGPALAPPALHSGYAR
ncbi:MAG: putative O-glycosylation ligase, exosortase A system-associated [Gammaproteobacteria bacterium]